MAAVAALRGATDSADGVLSRVMGVGAEATDVARGSALGGDVTVFLTSEALLNPAGFIVAFHRMCLVGPDASGQDQFVRRSRVAEFHHKRANGLCSPFLSKPAHVGDRAVLDQASVQCFELLRLFWELVLGEGARRKAVDDDAKSRHHHLGLGSNELHPLIGIFDQGLGLSDKGGIHLNVPRLKEDGAVDLYATIRLWGHRDAVGHRSVH